MKPRDALMALLLPIILWLLLGAPSLTLLGNLFVFAVVVAHLYMCIWNNYIFYILKGDAFTYGNVNRTINFCSFLWTFIASWLALHFDHMHIVDMLALSPYAWGLVCVGLLVPIAIPLLTSGVSSLPTSADRRTFEDHITKQD